MYGLKAISNVSPEVIEKIFAGRPYIGIKDFLNRCKLTKTVIINLIKAGAFDEIECILPNRRSIMAYYLSIASEPKKRLTLQNFNGLINAEMIPDKFMLQVRCFNFNKYLRGYKKYGDYYILDEQSIQFLEKFIPDVLDMAEQKEDKFVIKQGIWDKIYKGLMDPVRDWLKENQEDLLNKYNQYLFKLLWDKYAEGTTSAWEMDSLCFYHGDHELKDVSMTKYNLSDFSQLSTEPEVEYFFKRGRNQIPIYKLHRIVGTVISKNDNKSTISLLTTTGVVIVKMTRDQYSKYKKQISQVQPDGSKKVIEKGWFTRGRKLLITGFRRDDMFVAKTYAATQTHQIYLIEDVVDNEIKLRHNRMVAEGTVEEDYDE